MSARPIVVAALAAAATVAFAAPPVPASELLVPGAEVADAPLVTEAGDSAFVAPGDHAVLLGTAFGGTGSYEVTWSSPVGEVEDPTNPTAAIDTAGVEPGTYEATLQVTDSAGAVDSDTVAFVVAGEGAGEQFSILDETVGDAEPGVFVTDSAYEWEVEVPAGTAQLDVTVTWDVPTNDYDLEVVDPDGTVKASSGNAPPATTEATGVSGPAEGTWTVRALRYATVSDPSLHVVVTGTTQAGPGDDPRPSISTDGPYEFTTGTAQHVTAAVDGGSEPLTIGWDTDLDGIADDATGPAPTLDLPTGRHLVTAVVTDAEGFERREMTSVTVGTPEQIREMAVPMTVIGIADSGINPYHAEFSAGTYPDPEVLELTRNFTRHPSEYIPGYPTDAPALPATTGQGYFPAQDQYLWSVSEADDGTVAGDYVDAGTLYWIPGTKIVGAIDAGGSTGVTSGADTHPILDDNGHGTGSTSVSAGNRYGYCPTCLLVLVEALDETVVADYPWVDISSNSFGAVGGIPLGLVTGPDEPTRVAAERGQLTFFSAGNGTGNAFATTPILTYGSSPNGADWVISVGATREDNQGAIVSDGYPVHISALGDGDLPSACRTGDTGQCAFGGTSAASPYTAGAFGNILTEVRDALGDTGAGQTTIDGQGQVVAHGTAIADSPYLADGILTRDELRAVGLKTALPRGQGNGPDTTYPFPWTWEGDNSVWFEGYGSAGPAHAERAIAVLLGEMELPDRAEEDAFFAQDCEHRDALYGPYDRTGDGEADPCSEAGFARHVGSGPADNVDPSVGRFDASREDVADGEVLTGPITYHLHREPRFEPDREPVPVSQDPAATGDSGDLLETDVCGEGDNEQFMSRQDTDNDVDLCFDNRITSVPAAFRPKGIFTATDQLGAALPAGSTVTATIHMQSSEPTVASLEGVLKATDREVGRTAAVQQPVTPAGWTAFELEMTTDRLVAAGEQLTFHLVHAGVRSWAYGYSGDAASSITISPADAADGNEFGATIDAVAVDAAGVTASGRVAFPDLGEDPQLAGFHARSQLVQVSVDDAAFADPTYASVDPQAGTWTAAVPGADAKEVFVRAVRDRFPSAVTSRAVDAAGDDDDDDDQGNGNGPPDNPGNGNGNGPPDNPGNGNGPPDDPGNGNGGGNGPPDNPGNGNGNGPPSDPGNRPAHDGGADDDTGEVAEEQVAASSGDAPASTTVVNAATDPGPSPMARYLLVAVALLVMGLTLVSFRRAVVEARRR